MPDFRVQIFTENQAHTAKCWLPYEVLLIILEFWDKGLTLYFNPLPNSKFLD